MHDRTIDQDHGQRSLAPRFQQLADGGVRREGLGLLSEVEAFDGHPPALEPVHVSREGDESLLHVHAANTRAATEREIENLNLDHDDAPSMGDRGAGDPLGRERGLGVVRRTALARAVAALGMQG